MALLGLLAIDTQTSPAWIHRGVALTRETAVSCDRPTRPDASEYSLERRASLVRGHAARPSTAGQLDDGPSTRAKLGSGQCW